ncbi:MAG: helix-turn-helix domain protein [Firmicutes bacterium]|nr:helix-turn-helix domain protein [Bacillota bacterium]
MILLSEFAKRLKEIRKGRMTQGELADLLHTTQVQISLYETGKDDPSPALLEKIAEIFDVTIDYLSGKTPAKDASVDKEADTLAQRIKVIRVYYDKSQEEFAKDLSISQSALSSIEHGTIPSAEVIQKLGKMGFSLEWLLYGENNQPTSPKQVLEDTAADWEHTRINKLLNALSHDKLKLCRQCLELFVASFTKEK